MDMTMFRRKGLLLNTPHIVNESGSIVTFDSAYNKIPIKSLICNIEPIQEGTGDPSPENVRVISGRTGTSVVRRGKNLIPDVKNESETSTTVYFAEGNTDYNIYLKSGNYTFSINYIGSRNNYPNLYHKEAVGEVNNDGVLINSRTITITKDGFYRFWLYANPSNKDTIYTTDIASFQLELGSTATEYEPYKGSTYSVNWETEAGTVYGGYVDAVSGKLVVDRAKITFDGGETRNAATTDSSTNAYRYRITVSDMLYGSGVNGSQLCDKLRPTTGNTGSGSSSLITESPKSVTLLYNKATVYVNASGLLSEDSVSAFKAWLTANTPTLCYRLANPVEYQLTPQEVKTLLGENNIWCDSSDVSVYYWKWGN